MRKERLVPDSRIRRDFRLELALNQDVKTGKKYERCRGRREQRTYRKSRVV